MKVIVVACPQCKTRYKLPENARGKVVQCKNCNAKFAAGSQPRTAPPAAQPKNQSTRQPVAAGADPGLQKFGLDGPIRRTPDLFEVPPPGPNDPLANHVIEDPGFAPIEIPTSHVDQEETADNPLAGLLDNPAIEKPKVVVKKEDPLQQYLHDDDDDDLTKASDGNVDSSILLLIVLMVALSAMYVWPVLVSLRSIPSSTPIFVGLLGFHGFIFFVLNIWGLILAYKNTKSVLHLIIGALFFPYLIYLTFKYWSKPIPMRGFGMAYIGTTVAYLIGVTLFVLVVFVRAFAP